MVMYLLYQCFLCHNAVLMFIHPSSVYE